MTVTIPLQPDQNPDKWDDHVGVYEKVFEPLTNAFANRAFDLLEPLADLRLVDVGAGAGGASLAAAQRGAYVTAIDGSAGMVERLRARTSDTMRGRVRAFAMDGMRLALPGGHFDVGLSVFGIVLFPDAERGMRELHRILKPGGRLAIITWTQPHRYELMARLRDAVLTVKGEEPPSSGLPAQLRYVDATALAALVAGAGFAVEALPVFEETWRLASARWLAARLAFAPGLATMFAALGTKRQAVVEAFVAKLEADQGMGAISLGAVAHAAIGRKV
jgi:SAM-dependent methyltransferase